MDTAHYSLLPGACGSTRFDWSLYPLLVIWEATRACELACRHCRASAIREPNPSELSTREAELFIEQVSRARPDHFILTGGDPIMRRDLLHLVRYATSRGLNVSMSPSATNRLLAADLAAFRTAGLNRISLSLDGATIEAHDRFRGIRGTWTATMAAIAAVRDAELDFQINTTFTKQNIDQFDAFVNLMAELRPKMWNLFILVPTGRGRHRDQLTGNELESLFERLYALSRSVNYAIKTTEGQHYRRVALQQWKLRRDTPPPRMFGTNDGKGFVFVSHTGEIQPSGFLPITAGNVLTSELLDVYRNNPLFRALRDPDQLRGKCRLCEYRSICGGSRARAFATSGDYLGEEPLCIYRSANNSPVSTESTSIDGLA
jgi:radical SAM protein with 4Fe4S-binding SPASM domain